MGKPTLAEFHGSMTGAEERAVRETFGAPLHALRGWPLMRAAQFRPRATHRS